MSSRPDPNDNGPRIPFWLSPEDQRILQECNREAFFQRSVPCALGLGSITLLAVKAGYLKPNKYWGPTPKVVTAVFLGYLLGKLSYQRVCADKLMASPDSELGAALRAQKRKEEEHRRAPPQSRDRFGATSDSYKPGFDFSQSKGNENSSEKTYEELRRKNREEYEKRLPTTR